MSDRDLYMHRYFKFLRIEVSEFQNLIKKFPSLHCVKSVGIRNYPSPPFPAFGLNTEIHSTSLRIQSEYGKIRTRITPNRDTFYAMLS